MKTLIVLTIAAASNLTGVFQAIGPQFEQATGIHPVFSFGSTAQLALQIENGAPFDVFAAADTEHIDQLEKKGTPRAAFTRDLRYRYSGSVDPAGQF